MSRALTVDSKIPYYVVKNGRAYWDPRKEPRGFESRPLGLDGPEARQRAIDLYRGMKAAIRNGRGPVLTPDRHARGYVYFLVTGDFVKIGFSTNPFGRASALKTGLAAEMVAFIIVKGTRRFEKRLHDHFDGAKAQGEWFRKTDRLVDAIAKAAAGRLSEDGDF